MSWRQAQQLAQQAGAQAAAKIQAEGEKGDPLGGALGSIAGSAAGAAIGGPAGAKLGGSIGGQLGGKGYVSAEETAQAGLDAYKPQLQSGADDFFSKQFGGTSGGSRYGRSGGTPGGGRAHPMYGRYMEGGMVPDYKYRGGLTARGAAQIDPRWADRYADEYKMVHGEPEAPMPEAAAAPSIWSQAAEWFGGSDSPAPAPTPAPASAAPQGANWGPGKEALYQMYDALGFYNEGGEVEEPKWWDIAGHFEKRNKTLTGKDKEDRKTSYRAMGGPLSAPKGEQSFMMEHPMNFAEKVGPLAKVMHKSSGGEVHERSYHNPYAAPSQDKESAGKK